MLDIKNKIRRKKTNKKSKVFLNLLLHHSEKIRRDAHKTHAKNQKLRDVHILLQRNLCFGRKGDFGINEKSFDVHGISISADVKNLLTISPDSVQTCEVHAHGSRTQNENAKMRL